MRPLLALLMIAPLQAWAEVDQFQAGQHLMITATYDDTADTFSDNVSKGERTACFKVLKVADSEIELQLISGSFQPWWSDTAFRPGAYTDTWFDSNSYLEHRPSAQPLAQLKQIFSAVAKCPGQPSG